MLLLISYLFLALVVSFICSIVEAVILSVTSSFIRTKELEIAGSTKHLSSLKENIDRPLSAILTINTVAHTIGAAGVGAQAVAIFGEIYFGVISAVLTILILFFSEIIPKTIGATYWRKLAIPSSVIITGMIYISYPLVLISEHVTKLISKNKKTQKVSREEIVALAQLGKKDGTLQESESKVINNLIRLKTLNLKEIMTPRTVVVSAPEDTSLNDFVKQNEYTQHSRIPIYSGNIDNVTGYVLKADVFEALTKNEGNKNLGDLKRTILVFYEKLFIPKLFEKLIQKKEHIALIINEYGGVQGLITLEDIIETILGLEIVDEKDIEVDMQELAKKRWEARKHNLNSFKKDQ